MSQVPYVSNVRIDRIKGPLRKAYLPAEPLPVMFSVHGGRAARASILIEQYTRGWGSFFLDHIGSNVPPSGLAWIIHPVPALAYWARNCSALRAPASATRIPASA